MSGRDEDYVPLPTEAAGAKTVFVLFLAGPTIWFTHFMLVYLLAEVLCKPLRVDVRVAGLALVSFLTLVATVLAAVAAAAFSVWSLRRWQAVTRGASSSEAEQPEIQSHQAALAFTGFLLGALFSVAILFTGAPALWLQPC